ncbi:MAG TPA: hypothetical protein PLF79_14915 [Thauera sp.]|nr:hypothetical protein [Thauera sp.]
MSFTGKPDVIFSATAIATFYFQEHTMHSITPLHERFTEVVTANGDAFNAIVEITLNTAEQIFALNMNTARSYKANTTLSNRGGFFEQLTAQSGSAARSFELASDYLRNASSICIKSQAEIGQINVERANELAQSFGSLLDTMARSGPTGSAEVVEQIKSALSSATEAYEQVIRTSSEFAERSLAAAEEAVQPVVAAAGSTEKKVARKAA